MPRTRRHYSVPAHELLESDEWDGVHIYKCRFQFGDRDNETGAYPYSHHGIFHKKKGKVISFGWERRPEEDGIGDKIVNRVVLLANTGLNKFLKLTVHISKLDEYVNRRGEVCLYKYGQSTKTCDEADCAVRASDRNGHYAAVIAEWFLKHPKAFGKYRLETWNCEHFATFCHQTRFEVDELDKEFERTGQKPLSRSFLCKKGQPFSLQAQRLFGKNSNILCKSADDSDDELLVNIFAVDDDDDDNDELAGGHEEPDGVFEDDQDINGSIATGGSQPPDETGNEHSELLKGSDNESSSPPGRGLKRKHDADGEGSAVKAVKEQ